MPAAGLTRHAAPGAADGELDLLYGRGPEAEAGLPVRQDGRAEGEVVFVVHTGRDPVPSPCGRGLGEGMATRPKLVLADGPSPRPSPGGRGGTEASSCFIVASAPG